MKSEFAAAHAIRDIGGRCENLHGHTWIVSVSFSGHELSKAGVILDFRVVKKWLRDVLDTLDHQNLNELECFSAHGATTELIAHHVAMELKLKAREYPVRLCKVEVRESPMTGIVYYPDE